MMSTSLNVIKYMLFLFNVLFVVTGLTLLSIGAVIKAAFHGYQPFLDDSYFSASNLLIAVGLIVLLVSFLGCCGAIKENHCMMVSFIALLVLIFILELSAGIAGYVCRNKVEDVLKNTLMDSMKKYNSTDPNSITSVLWDSIQTKFECCGATNYKDWMSLTPDPTQGGKTLPLSCCAKATGFGPQYCNETSTPKVYQEGCTVKFGEFIADKAVVIGGTGITIALIQLLGILMANRLASALRRAVNELHPM